MDDRGPQKLKDLFEGRYGAGKDRAGGKAAKKPPAYEWQDMALKIIKELGVPDFKRNSVFKICRDNPKQFVLNCLNDTKELCRSGEKWKYFFKIAGKKKE